MWDFDGIMALIGVLFVFSIGLLSVFAPLYAYEFARFLRRQGGLNMPEPTDKTIPETRAVGSILLMLSGTMLFVLLLAAIHVIR